MGSIAWLSLRSKPSATLRGEGESQPAQQQCWSRGLGAAGHPQAKPELRGGWYHKDGSCVYDTVCECCHLPPGTVEATDGGTTFCRRWRQSGRNPEEQWGRTVKIWQTQPIGYQKKWACFVQIIVFWYAEGCLQQTVVCCPPAPVRQHKKKLAQFATPENFSMICLYKAAWTFNLLHWHLLQTMEITTCQDQLSFGLYPEQEGGLHNFSVSSQSCFPTAPWLHDSKPKSSFSRATDADCWLYQCESARGKL